MNYLKNRSLHLTVGMEKWIIESTDRSPNVVLDRQLSVLRVEGRSYPEEGMDFFDPIILRLKSLQDTDNPIKVVHIRLEYYNSATSKAIAELLNALIRAKGLGHEVKVIWEYEEDDDTIQEDIDMFIETFDLPFEIRYTEFS